MEILYGVKTDKGLNREINEDSYIIIDENNGENSIKDSGLLFAVADGMGGHVAGEKASSMACELLRDPHLIAEQKDTGEDFFRLRVKELENKLHDINNMVLRSSEENEEYSGMGTTLTSLVLMNDKALIAHVGDSRIYRSRGDHFEQLTADHTEVQALIDMGRLKPERAAIHPRRHILTQAIGIDDKLEDVFTRMEDLSEADIFLLCSDGLYDMVQDKEIKKILNENLTPQAACERLVEAALENGGEDNVTVIVVKII